MHLDGARESRAELDLGDRLAQRLDELGKGVAGHRLGLLPGGRAHEGKARRQRRRRGGDRGERRTRDGSRVGILLVEAGERLGQEGHVPDRAREHADVIEGAREKERSAARR